jgi:sporulation protein YlmC with PRC-barrel domain
VIRASDLIGCVVRTESGERVGRVHDLRARAIDGGWQLEGLIVGGGGVISRLTGSGTDPLVRGDFVPWQAITALDDGLVSVRDSFELCV